MPCQHILVPSTLVRTLSRLWPTPSFMGISYWLVPVIVGHRLWSRRLALSQAWLWFVGMIVFSFALHDLGLMGMPRRTWISMATYIQPTWRTVMPLVGIGGSIMSVSAMLYFVNLVLTCLAARQPALAMPAFADALAGPEEAPAFLDRLRPSVDKALHSLSWQTAST